MRKIIDYKVIDSNDIDDLQVAVKNDIDKGWQPLGGISDGSAVFAQVMVKYDLVDELTRPSEMLRELMELPASSQPVDLAGRRADGNYGYDTPPDPGSEL